MCTEIPQLVPNRLSNNKNNNYDLLAALSPSTPFILLYVFLVFFKERVEVQHQQLLLNLLLNRSHMGLCSVHGIVFYYMFSNVF